MSLNPPVVDFDPNSLIATAPEGPIQRRYIKFVYTGEPDVETKYREVMFVGDFGVGKTRALLDALLISAFSYPGAQLALLRDTGKNLEISTLPILLKVFDTAFKTGALKMHGDHIEVYNGSVIWLFGLDVPQAVNKLKSAEFLRIFVDQAETVGEERWDLAMLRTRQKVKHKDFDVNGPHYIKGAANWDDGENWIMRRFRMHAKQLEHGIFETEVVREENPFESKRPSRIPKRAYRLLLEGTAEENESLPDDYFEAMLLAEESGATGKYFSGQWTRGEGLVFPMFRYTTHTVDDVVLVGEYPVYVGIDWGVFHPAVAVLSYLDDRGTAVVFDEYVASDTSADDVAWAVARLVMRAYGQGHKEFYFALDRSMKKRERDLGSVWTDFEAVFKQAFPKDLRWRMTEGSSNIDSRTNKALRRMRTKPNEPPKIVVARRTAPKVAQMLSTIKWEDVKKDTPPLVDLFDAFGYMVSIMPDKRPLSIEQIKEVSKRSKRRNSFLPRRR